MNTYKKQIVKTFIGQDSLFDAFIDKNATVIALTDKHFKKGSLLTISNMWKKNDQLHVSFFFKEGSYHYEKKEFQCLISKSS